MSKAEKLQKVIATIARVLSPWVEDGRTGKVCLEVNISQGCISAPVVETKETIK